MQNQLSFAHKYIPAPVGGGAETLLLLHGTGGDENDLLPLGKMLNSNANLLSPRGSVLENGMPRFFRRLAEGVLDVPDLIVQSQALAEFIAEASTVYGFDSAHITAAGFSNGANIAGALLLLHPGVLKSAILLHPMVPLVPEVLPDLTGTSIFIGAGRQDPLVSVLETERLAALFRQSSADVTIDWQPGGHTLTREEASAAASWLKHRSSH
ncbi:MAG: alpha/beta hydrolase [Janthinobacterium lividum]